jgi:hypothetical protein
MRQTLFATTIVLLVMSVLASTASADYTCYGNSSQFSTTVITSGNSTSIAYNETCRFGCNSLSGECNSGPFNSSADLLYLIMPVIAFVLLYFTSMLKPEDWYMHILIIGAAMYFIVAPMGVVAEKFAGPFVGLYWMSIVIAFIVVFYYIMKVLVRAYQASAKGAK